jgi:hypothetical protein
MLPRTDIVRCVRPRHSDYSYFIDLLGWEANSSDAEQHKFEFSLSYLSLHRCDPVIRSQRNQPRRPFRPQSTPFRAPIPKRGRRHPRGLGGNRARGVPSDQVRSCQRSTGAPAAGSTRRLASAPVSSGSCDRLQSYVRFRRNVANGRRRRADSTIAVRRNGAGSGAHHFRLAHLRFALMMTARAQPTTGRGGADGGDGG